MIIIGAIFDFFDGFAARILNAKSELGKQLDSLADMSTFGILPALILFKIASGLTSEWYVYLTLLVAPAAGLRLAKFNIDERQTNYFLGLPTPANAILICSIPFIITESHVQNMINPISLVVLSFILSILMNIPLPLLSFKFSHYRWKGNKYRYILILLFLVLMYYLSFLSIPLIFLAYIIFSILSKPGSEQLS